jgi:predicted transposase/invertase (TIGR01784 family)
MQFLKATTDIAFKKLFGNQAHSELTISFLNAILERKEGELITKVSIHDGANYPDTFDKKVSFIDVSCTDQTGKKYIIEMQVINEHNFIERSQYYASLVLSRQLNKKGHYEDLVPVIFVGVVYFKLFKGADYLSHHLILDQKTHEHALKHLEFHFIELSKFEKTIEELTSTTQKWVYLIKHAHELYTIPAQFKNPQEMAEAFGVLNRGGWTENEFDAYEAELDTLRRTVWADEAKELKHEKELLAAREAAEQTKAVLQKTICNMLAEGITIDNIARITGLPVEQIRKLQNK